MCSVKPLKRCQLELESKPFRFKCCKQLSKYNQTCSNLHQFKNQCSKLPILRPTLGLNYYGRNVG